jgi:hypothetical protein
MPLGAVLEAVVPVLALRRFIPGLGQAMVRRGFSDRGDGRDRENAGEDRRCELRGSDYHLQTLRLRYATLRFVKSRQNNWAVMGHNSGPEMALFGLAPWARNEAATRQLAPGSASSESSGRGTSSPTGTGLATWDCVATQPCSSAARLEVVTFFINGLIRQDIRTAGS